MNLEQFENFWKLKNLTGIPLGSDERGLEATQSTVGRSMSIIAAEHFLSHAETPL